MNADLAAGPSQLDDVEDTICGEEGGENQGNTKDSFKESSPEAGSCALSPSSPNAKPHSASKKVAFVSIKNHTPAPQSVQGLSPLTTNVKAFHFLENESNQTKDDGGDSLASLLTDVNAKDSLF